MTVTNNFARFTAQDLIAYTLPELQNLCSLIMDTITARQGNVASEAMEELAWGLVCPHCGSVHCVKNGKVRTKQRFLCRDCKKTFGTNPYSALAHSKLKPEKWKEYIKCMVHGFTLEKSAEIVGVCLKTSFYMRHKILNALNCVGRDTVSGIVEMDETFVAESFKGNHKKSGFKMPRKARKRGHQVTKRGLSDEQVCIGTAIDRKNNLIMGMTGTGRVSYDELERLFGDHVVEGSTLLTDSLNSYRKLSGKLKAAHRAIPSGERSLKVEDEIFTLSRVNSLHSRFKTWLDRFHGVSTKHLGSYLAWFKWIEQVKGLKENAKAGQMWQDVLSELVDVRIQTIRSQAPAFV